MFIATKDEGVIPYVLTQILDACVNGVTLSDPDLPDSPLVYVNRVFEEMSGYTQDEMIALRRGIFRGVTAPYVSTYEFDDLKASTRLTFTFELRDVEARLRPFEKLIRIALEDGAKRTVKRLKLLIEREMLDDY